MLGWGGRLWAEECDTGDWSDGVGDWSDGVGVWSDGVCFVASHLVVDVRPPPLFMYFFPTATTSSTEKVRDTPPKPEA